MSSKSFTKIIAHRGFGKQHIENTIPAFKEAKSAKADMIELDIHETRDGHFIVYHDDSLDEKSPPWRDLTYIQIRELTKQDNRAPLLSDCLEVIGSTPVDIEVKSCLNINNIVKELSSYPLAEGSIISSLDFTLLKHLHSNGINRPLLLIVAISKRRSFPQNLRNTTIFLFPKFLPKFLEGVSIYRVLARNELIKTLKTAGAKVFVWTVDEPADMSKFISWRVDGIVTNHVDILRGIRDQSP